MENQINIEEKKTLYDITYMYHSGMKCQNYEAKIIGIEEENGRLSLEPDRCNGFEFQNSDPDRVIAIAQMMMAFAQMVKNKNNKPIDTELDA